MVFLLQSAEKAPGFVLSPIAGVILLSLHLLLWGAYYGFYKIKREQFRDSDRHSGERVEYFKTWAIRWLVFQVVGIIVFAPFAQLDPWATEELAGGEILSNIFRIIFPMGILAFICTLGLGWFTPWRRHLQGKPE